MTAWTVNELDKIEKAEELEIAPRRRDETLRSPVPIWVVRVGEELYVRSWHGRQGSWFRTAQANRAGRIQAGGVEKEVTFVEEIDSSINDQVDAAYRKKYGRYSQYVEPMVRPEARATTLKLTPRAASA